MKHSKHFSGVRVSKTLIEDLNLLAELSARQEREGEDLPYYLVDQIAALRMPVVELFLPIVKLLVSARAFGVWVKETELDEDNRIFTSGIQCVGGWPSIVVTAREGNQINLVVEGITGIIDGGGCGDPDCDCHVHENQKSQAEKPVQNKSVVQMGKSETVH